MGDGANRVLAGVVGSFCEGRLSIAFCVVAVDRHLQQVQALLPGMLIRLGTIIMFKASLAAIRALLERRELFNLGLT